MGWGMYLVVAEALLSCSSCVPCHVFGVAVIALNHT